jgi:hypothetical protein
MQMGKAAGVAREAEGMEINTLTRDAGRQYAGVHFSTGCGTKGTTG